MSLLAATALTVGGNTMALANPTNPSVQAGNVTISQPSSTLLQIDQSSSKAIINWQSFSIQSGETTQFRVPTSADMTLNRVTGPSVSNIFGTLRSNGQLFLVNPHGIWFAPGSFVDVNSLVATTAGIANANFLAGRLRFDRATAVLGASVRNDGSISIAQQGFAALVAPSVSNSGIIAARLGKVGLASGETFTLDPYGDGLFSFDVTADVTAARAGNVDARVSNTGSINADGGYVALTARTLADVVSRSINMGGIIEARAVDQIGGTIVLHGGDYGVVAAAGTMDASGAQAGQRGGTVKVLGDKVGLFDGAGIDVSGDAGGGTALVGGNFQGKGSEPNAKRTYIDGGAEINADAITSGDGGTVIVWADEVTRYDGNISARGGDEAGNGGFVEVSGKINLAFRGTVDLSAPNGDAGTLLLDPKNIIIANGGVAVVADNDAFGENVAADATMDADLITAILNAGTNLTLQANNDITVNEVITVNNGGGDGGDFTLQAGRTVAINANITTDNGVLTITANDTGARPSAPEGSTTR